MQKLILDQDGNLVRKPRFSGARLIRDLNRMNEGLATEPPTVEEVLQLAEERFSLLQLENVGGWLVQPTRYGWRWLSPDGDRSIHLWVNGERAVVTVRIRGYGGTWSSQGRISVSYRSGIRRVYRNSRQIRRETLPRELELLVLGEITEELWPCHVLLASILAKLARAESQMHL